MSIIKFHRPNVLIAQLGTPPSQRTQLQKIFHKKKDDLSPDQRRAMQMDADRSSRKKILGGWISFKRKKPVGIENKEVDVQSLTKPTIEQLRTLAGRMRELPERDPEHIQMRIRDANDVVNKFNLAARNGVELSNVLSNDEITYLKKVMEMMATVELEEPVSSKPEEPELKFLTTSIGEYLRALASRIRQQDEENLKRIKVANEIVNVFSTAARNGIDLSKVLSNDESIYLTRAMGMAEAPESLRVKHDGKPIVKKVNRKNEFIRKGTYTGSFDLLKNVARQTAGLLHSSQVDRLLERMEIAASALDKSTRNLKTQPRISAGAVLENVDKVLTTLTHIAPAELSRLCNQPGEQGDLAESRILDSLNNLQASINGLHEGMQALVSSKRMRVAGLLGRIQARVTELRNEIRLFNRMSSAYRLLKESAIKLGTQPSISAGAFVENVERVKAALTDIDPAELSRLCNQPGEQGDLAKSRILGSLNNLQARTNGLLDGTLKALASPESRNLRKEVKGQLKLAARLLERMQVDLVVLRNETAQTSAPSATPLTPPRTSNLQASSASTPDLLHHRCFSYLPQLRHRPFGPSLRLSTGTAVSPQKRKNALDEAPSKGMTLPDHLNLKRPL